MRTTLDVDEDVLEAAREIAARQRRSIGRVVSDLARQGLTRNQEADQRNGVPLFPVASNANVVTLGLVNRLRDESA